MKTIGTEEHFVTDEVVTAWNRLDSPANDDSRATVPPGEMGATDGEDWIGAPAL